MDSSEARRARVDETLKTYSESSSSGSQILAAKWRESGRPAIHCGSGPCARKIAGMARSHIFATGYPSGRLGEPHQAKSVSPLLVPCCFGASTSVGWSCVGAGHARDGYLRGPTHLIYGHRK